MLSLIIWLGLLGNTPDAPPKAQSSTLIVQVADIKKKSGWIRVALYKNDKKFLKDKGQYIGKSIPVTDTEMTITFEGLPYDDYAIAVYHDTNSNFKFDTNFFGIPTEPYGFGKTPKTKWRAPQFEEVGSSINTPNKTVQVSIKKWINY